MTVRDSGAGGIFVSTESRITLVLNFCGQTICGILTNGKLNITVRYSATVYRTTNS